MARRYTNLSDRIVYVVSTGLIKAQGTTVTIYRDAGASQPANLAHFDPTDIDTPGTAVSGAVLPVDAYSLRAGFWDLDDLSVLYAVASGGAAEPIYPDPQPQIDALAEDAAGPPSMHAATHGIAGNDPITVNQSQVAGLDDALASIGVRLPVHYLDVFTNFFGGSAYTWMPGQGVSATTLTAQATAGATTLAVTSPTGLIVGTVLITNPGTATQQILKVTAVAGSNLTVAPAVATTLANGATICPLWADPAHLIGDPFGIKAFGYYVANARDADGNYIFAGANKKIVWLGDSWAASGSVALNTALTARLGATTVINAGVPGNNLSQMIARFATDVAVHDPNYVVLEFGVNDIYQGVSGPTMSARLETAVALVRELGAIPVITGIVPLAEYVTAAEDRNLELRTQVGTGTDFPMTSMTAVSTRYPALQTTRTVNGLRFGPSTQPLTTGDYNTAIGATAQRALTTGLANTGVGFGAQNKITTPSYNTAIGMSCQYSLTTGASNTGVGGNTQFGMTTGTNNTAIGQAAQFATTSGGQNTAIGQNAQNAMTTASSNTAVGQSAQSAVTTGANNTAIGQAAQAAPAGQAANATTTGIGQTSVGFQSGQGSAAQSNYITTAGYYSRADGAYSTALGANTNAGAAGAVALGVDNAGTGASTAVANEIAIGTALHTTRLQGGLKLAAATTARPSFNVPHGAAPTTPVDGDVWTTTAGLFVRINGATVGPLT